jgi:hypothetical protein
LGNGVALFQGNQTRNAVVSVKKPQARSAAKKARFLEALATGTTITGAADSAGINRTLPYSWRKHDDAFDVAYKDALESGTDALRDEARRRAMGIQKPVMFSGKQVVGADGEPLFTVEYSDVLLMFLLKSRAPAEFDDAVRAATIKRRWDKADARRCETTGETVPLEAVVVLLSELAGLKARLAVSAASP